MYNYLVFPDCFNRVFSEKFSDFVVTYILKSLICVSLMLLKVYIHLCNGLGN